ncbi:MAG TPA: hypothetical protein VFW05_00260, partial [Verrucomicrobiae bacterium]|nr:hypothetical protein [Verrucomicrobiae bacterium]
KRTHSKRSARSGSDNFAIAFGVRALQRRFRKARNSSSATRLGDHVLHFFPISFAPSASEIRKQIRCQPSGGPIDCDWSEDDQKRNRNNPRQDFTDHPAEKPKHRDHNGKAKIKSEDADPACPGLEKHFHSHKGRIVLSAPPIEKVSTNSSLALPRRSAKDFHTSFSAVSERVQILLDRNHFAATALRGILFS